jgi:hypothetical protein
MVEVNTPPTPPSPVEPFNVEDVLKKLNSKEKVDLLSGKASRLVGEHC